MEMDAHSWAHGRPCFFLRERDRTLLVGDAFCTTKAESMLAVATQPTELHGPPAYYTPDWAAARLSVQELAALRAITLAPGHGLPISGEHVPEAVARLARDFIRIAVPENRIGGLKLKKGGRGISPSRPFLSR